MQSAFDECHLDTTSATSAAFLAQNASDHLMNHEIASLHPAQPTTAVKSDLEIVSAMARRALRTCLRTCLRDGAPRTGTGVPIFRVRSHAGSTVGGPIIQLFLQIHVWARNGRGVLAGDHDRIHQVTKPLNWRHLARCPLQNQILSRLSD